jgi:hypothetical protein
MPDSLSTDTTTFITVPDSSIVAAPRKVMPKMPWSTVCPHAAVPSLPSDSMYRVNTSTSWQSGMSGSPRPVSVGYDSGVLTLLLVSFIIVSVGIRHGARLWKNLAHDLFDVRRRSNAFDERTTGETWVAIAMVFQNCIYTGLLLYAASGLRGETASELPTFTTVALMTAIAIVLYLFRICAYGIIGYAFTDKIGSQQWIRGFNASQALLGCMLIVPALVATFYPHVVSSMLILAIILYFIAEIVFICKGFRIFYLHFESLLYFILYLCAVEIIPLVLAFYTAMNIHQIIVII